MKKRTIEEIIEDMTELLKEVYLMGMQEGWEIGMRDAKEVAQNEVC